MTTFEDLKTFISSQNIRVIIAADAETVVLEKKDGQVSQRLLSGGVSVVLDPLAKASSAVYIGRSKTEDEKEIVGKGETKIEGDRGSYILKRVYLENGEFDNYYNGFSNQTLWPLCHVAFENPAFHRLWYEGYVSVNKKFAESIKNEIKGDTFIWVNDYQLCLVPKFLNRPKNAVIGFFWHIPWPTWEAFRILPQKKEIIESLLMCDFIGFHRGYQARNFIETVRREFEVRVEEETSKIYYKGHVTTVKSLPLGIDTDVVSDIAKRDKKEGTLEILIKKILRTDEERKNESPYIEYFRKYKVILGVDRLDYTKGLLLRLDALDRFFENNKKYIGKAIYLGLMAPSRDTIPSYKALKDAVEEEAEKINKKYGKNGWRPIHLIYQTFSREEIVDFYLHASLCLVTPRDDGMNLVSKEFVMAASFSKNPGMLVLSQFAGSATDLSQALIVNPYDKSEVVNAIRRGLEMKREEKVRRTRAMAKVLEENNVYKWGVDFFQNTIEARQPQR